MDAAIAIVPSDRISFGWTDGCIPDLPGWRRGGKHTSHDRDFHRSCAVFAAIALLTFSRGTAMAETITFDADVVGTLPAGWVAGVTGRGDARWSVEADAGAPSKPNVLKQSGAGEIPWCVVRTRRWPTASSK